MTEQHSSRSSAAAKGSGRSRKSSQTSAISGTTSTASPLKRMGNQRLVESLRVSSGAKTLAQTRGGQTTVHSDVLKRPNAPEILAHEAVHRDQFRLSGSRPQGTHRQLEAEAHQGAHEILRGASFVPRFSAPANAVLNWCEPGTECVVPHDFVGPLAEGWTRAPDPDATPEVVELSESDILQPGSSDYLVAIANGRMAILPAPGNYARLRVPTAPAGTTAATPAEAPTPLVTMPTIGKNAMRVVNVGGGTAFALDAGGTPSLVFPSAMAHITSALEVSSISGVIIMHIHQDHVNRLYQLVTDQGISAQNIRVPASFEVNAGAPSSTAANAMTQLRARMGADANFGTIQVAGRPGPVFHQRIVEGQVAFDMYGLTGEFNTLANSRRRGERQPNADTASLLIRTTHLPTGTGVLFLGDLRGADLAQFRSTMTPEMYQRMVSGVRIVSGFQHHMGTLSEPTDRRGLTQFLMDTLVANRGLSVVVQSQETRGRNQYLNRSLIHALNNIGVNVHVAGAPVDGGGSVTVMSDSTIRSRGSGVESFSSSGQFQPVFSRLDRLVEAENILRSQGHNATNGGQKLRQITAAREALEGRVRSFISLNIEGVRAGASNQHGSPTLTNSTDVQRARRLMEVYRPIEMELLLPATMRNLRELARTGPYIDIYRAEVQRWRLNNRQGPFPPRAIEALWELNPRETRRLLQQSGLSRREISRIQQRLPGAPISAGRGAIGKGLIAIEVFNQIGPVVAQYRRNARSRQMGTFAADIMFWQSTGMRVDVQGTDDNLWPYENEHTTDMGRINELVAERELDYLAVTGIPDNGDELRLGNWDMFSIWAHNNIRNINDWDEFVSNNDAIRSEGSSIRDRTYSYRTGSINGTMTGMDLDITWNESEQLSSILNSVAEQVVTNSTEEIRSIETQSGSSYNQHVLRAGPDEYSHYELYENMPQAQGLLRFRTSIDEEDRRLYTLSRQSSRDVHRDLLMYRFPDSAYPNGEVPEGYIVVGGADYNSYINIKNTPNLVDVHFTDRHGLARVSRRRANLEVILVREEDVVAATR